MILSRNDNLQIVPIRLAVLERAKSSHHEPYEEDDYLLPYQSHHSIGYLGYYSGHRTHVYWERTIEDSSLRRTSRPLCRIRYTICNFANY